MTRTILYLGKLTSGQSSLYRLRALQRLQQDVYPFDYTKYRFRLPKMNSLAWRFPVGPMVAKINADLVAAVRERKPEVVWFDKPIFFTPATIRSVQLSGAQTVCY